MRLSSSLIDKAKGDTGSLALGIEYLLMLGLLALGVLVGVARPCFDDITIIDLVDLGVAASKLSGPTV